MKIKDCIIVNNREDYDTIYEFIRKIDNADWLRRTYFPQEFPIVLYLEKGGFEYSSMPWYKKHAHKYKLRQIQALLRLEKLNKIKDYGSN